MTKATTYLSRYEKMYRNMQKLIEMIRELEVKATAGSGAIRYDKDRVVSSPTADTMQLIERKVDLERCLYIVIRDMMLVRQKQETLFKNLPPLDRRIARMTWLDFEGPVFISQCLKVSRSTVTRRKEAILAYVQQELDAGRLT